MSTPSLVQAIAVAPGTHFQTVAAVSIASAVSATHAPAGHTSWSAWMGQAFTKTVRRAKRPIEIETLENDPLVAHRHQLGSARAFAYAPMAYDDFPSHLRKLQVANLDVDRSLDPHLDHWESPTDSARGPLDPLVVINRDVPMSTGKTAAQVAHALVAWSHRLPRDSQLEWAQNPSLRLLVADLDRIPEAGSITIRDNGLTEVVPGTATVRIATI